MSKIFLITKNCFFSDWFSARSQVIAAQAVVFLEVLMYRCLKLPKNSPQKTEFKLNLFWTIKTCHSDHSWFLKVLVTTKLQEKSLV